jgi:micrococcal nuclease
VVRRRRSKYAVSRRKRAVLIGLTLIGTALFVWLDRGFVAPQWAGTPTSGGRTLATDLARYHGGRFPVVRVVDGDTLHLGVADADGATTRVRLVGIDAPEMGGGDRERMYFAEEATAFVERLALDRQVTVYLDEQAGSRDRYGRLLAYIQLSDGGFLNEELLSEGFAYAHLRFRHGYYQKYQQLEAGARALKKGLWAGVQPHQMPAWRQRTKADEDR